MKNKGFTLIELLAVIVIIGILILIIVPLCTGCNYEVIDTKYQFNTAVCNYNGDKFELKIDKWKDYEGEQIQIKSNGKTYLLSANNCYLIDE